MDTFEDVIEYAIQLEQRSIELYTNLAQRVTRTEIKEVFLEMVKAEEGHRGRLQNILTKHRLPNGKKFYPDADLKISDYVVDVDPNKEDLSFDDALVIGMKMEKASEALYLNLAKQHSDPELKETFLYLAEEEAKHKHDFEGKFDDLQ